MNPARTPNFLAAGLLSAFAFTAGYGAPTLVAGETSPVPVPATTNAPSKLISSEDGWLDVSAFLDEAYGFVPLVIPITEPAVGYGGAGGVAFIDQARREAEAGFGRPNITAVGGLATENGTWGVLAGDSRHWLDDRLQTGVGLAYASANLGFYGVGADSGQREHPLNYNLQPLGGMLQAKYRLGDSRAWAGLGYSLAQTRVSVDGPGSLPILSGFQADSRVGGLTPTLTYDSRDTIFTPRSGTYAEVSAGLFSPVLGGDVEFQRVNGTVMQFLPLLPKLTLGLRSDLAASFGRVPFYLRPAIAMRGVPAMRYQGNDLAQGELELQWQCWKRFSLVGFGGGGAAWTGGERLDRKLTVAAGGTGIRYELARKYGLHVGMDVAFGPAGPAYYVQFGSAWMRP